MSLADMDESVFDEIECPQLSHTESTRCYKDDCKLKWHCVASAAHEKKYGTRTPEVHAHIGHDGSFALTCYSFQLGRTKAPVA